MHQSREKRGIVFKQLKGLLRPKRRVTLKPHASMNRPRHPQFRCNKLINSKTRFFMLVQGILLSRGEGPKSERDTFIREFQFCHLLLEGGLLLEF